MTAIHPDLLAVSDAVEVVSPTRYVFRGEAREAAPGGEQPDGANAPLLTALENELYFRLYIRPVAGPAAPAAPLAERDHLAALSAANNGRGTWEPGWTVGALDEDGRLAVTKDGLTFWARPEDVRVHGGVPRAGEFCRVRVGKELRHLMPGYYVAIGNGDERDPRDDPEPLVRLYWHLSAPAAVSFVAEVTATLNTLDVPFRAKALSDPGAYRRADAGIIYLGRRHYRRLADAVAALHERLAAGLRPTTPLFTWPLAPGLGFAEDPGNGMSFGQHRCRLLAHGLWLSFVQGDRTAGARAATLAATFRNAGLDPEAPHLEPGSPIHHILRSRGEPAADHEGERP
ncbi:MAG TPA: T3SS effector HopA1 family protein [Gemmataceae bacterium]|nr:T3SS effector HopA1 family protein [Gemmataceae bacterium]